MKYCCVTNWNWWRAERRAELLSLGPTGNSEWEPSFRERVEPSRSRSSRHSSRAFVLHQGVLPSLHVHDFTLHQLVQDVHVQPFLFSAGNLYSCNLQQLGWAPWWVRIRCSTRWITGWVGNLLGVDCRIVVSFTWSNNLSKRKNKNGSGSVQRQLRNKKPALKMGGKRARNFNLYP